jgi:four helix bundle protein
MQSYKELLAWQHSMQLVSSIYRATKLFPREEVYGLTSQLRRSAVSVPSNIAEGQGRATRGEFLQFLGHARGSLFEVETQLILAGELGYLPSSDVSQLLNKMTRVAQLLNGLISSLRTSGSKRSTIHDSRSTNG